MRVSTDTWLMTFESFLVRLLFSMLIDLLIILINGLAVWSIKCQKMLKNNECCFPKPNMMSLYYLFGPQPKDIKYSVIEEERHHKIFHI